MSQAHPAERVPRAAARRSGRRARGRRVAARAPSSCTASPTSRPGSSSRWTGCAKGGEIDKEIYVLRRLQADEDDGDAGLGLHFDLTVPFARYVLEHAGQLEFPFRRYQIQPAWRGERPQEGRYRQFTQADVDIVGRDVLPFHHDVEVMRVMVEALDALPLPPLSFQFNNRKLIQGFYRGLGMPDVTAAIRTIDKLDKLPARRRSPTCWSSDAGATPEQAERCLELADDPGRRTPSFVDQVRALGVEDDLLDEGCRAGRRRRGLRRRRARDTSRSRPTCGSPAASTTTPAPSSRSSWRGYERLKSVGGGGRYDALATDGRTTYPGVGVSFGVSRTLVPLLADGVLAGSRSVPSAVLVALADEESPARGRDAVASGCAPAASPPRSPPAPRSSASRSGTPSGAASPSSGSPARTARHRPGQGHPQRRPGRRRPGRLDTARRGPATPHGPTRSTDQHRPARSSHSDPHPRRRQPCAPSTSARPSPSPAGWPAAATTAASPSSTCARPAASSRWSSATRRSPTSCAPSTASRSPARSSARPEGNENPNLPTGEVEVIAADGVEVLSAAAPLPFPIDDHVEVGEEVRLAHRYLDLRRSGPAAAIRLRSEVNRAAREVLHDAAASSRSRPRR